MSKAFTVDLGMQLGMLKNNRNQNSGLLNYEFNLILKSF
jgi:hypothetical protein